MIFSKKIFFISIAMISMIVPSFLDAKPQKYSHKVIKIMMVNDVTWEVIVPCVVYVASCFPQARQPLDLLSMKSLLNAAVAQWLGSYPQASIQSIIDKYVELLDDANHDEQDKSGHVDNQHADNHNNSTLNS